MKRVLIMIVSVLLGVCVPRDTLLAQARGRVTKSDSTQIAKVVSQYIRSTFRGKLGFDVGMTCRFGRACEEPARKLDRDLYDRNKQLFGAIRDGAGGVTIPLKSASTCPPGRPKSCRLLVDHYFQVFQPTIFVDSAKFGMWVSQDSPGLHDDIYMATTSVALALAKNNGRWRVSRVKTHPTT